MSERIVECRVETRDPRGNPLRIEGRMPEKACRYLKRARIHGVILVAEGNSLLLLSPSKEDLKALGTLVVAAIEMLVKQARGG